MVFDTKYNEDAIELLAEILEPFSEIIGDAGFQKIYEEKPLAAAVAYAMKNHSHACALIVAAANDESLEEYKFNAWDAIGTITRLLANPHFGSLFTSQGRKSESASSGSAMENTEESAQQADSSNT